MLFRSKPMTFFPKEYATAGPIVKANDGNLSIKDNIWIDTNNITLGNSDFLTPSTFQASQAVSSNTVDSSIEKFNESGTSNSFVNTTINQGPKTYKLKVRGVIVSLCYQARSVGIKKMVTFGFNPEKGGFGYFQEIPILEKDKIDQKIWNNRSHVPIYVTTFEQEYTISNPQIGRAHV